jgi:hypothetical protein
VAAPKAAAARKKRLGQYFTGPKLALLLNELADASHQASIIDPMAGTGDMLVAARRAGAREARLAGVEIDPVAATTCESQAMLQAATIINRDAFDSACYEELGWHWDLVVTNPPYVRYQHSQRTEFDDLMVPSPDDVRSNLLATIKTHPMMDEAERSLLTRAAESYSGLADLAVPSWLLCCALTRPGGRLALVVPDTWLSRDYAAPVLRVLEDRFDLQYVVEDRDVAWFTDALVRTTLVVAIKRPTSAPLAHTRLVVPRSASTTSSLVGAAFPGRNPERKFARWAATWDPDQSPGHGGIEVVHDDGVGLARAANPTLGLPRQVRAILGDVRVVSLAELGWSVGQGIRTGANDLFYVKAEPDGTVRSVITGDRPLSIDQSFLRPSIRRQADVRGLGLGRSAKNTDAGWRLLMVPDPAALQGREQGALGSHLADLLSVAEITPGPNGVLIPDLSAVRVNARASDENKAAPARLWYHLPPLAPRHTGAIFVSRVNGGAPIFFANPSAKVIDANFSTLWAEQEDAPSVAGLIAFFQSAWVQACLECSCTVMAGGALKVEATHLRRLPIPAMDEAAWSALDKLGRQILRKSGLTALLRASVDCVIESAIVQPGTAFALDELATSQRLRRNGSES